MQWNSRGVLNKKGDLQNISDDYDILLLSETFLKPGKNFVLKNFNLIRADRLSNRGGGLAIAIRTGINFSRISSIFNDENSLETLSISINSSEGELLIVSVYRVPASDNIILSNTWSILLNSISVINSNSVFIGGDFNSHHSSWGSSHNCTNGAELCSSLDQSNFICLNDGRETFASRPGQSPSVLDLSFLTPNLYTNCSWDVWGDAMGSDHFPVVTSLGVSIPISPFFTHKYKLKRINWPSFSSNLLDFIKINEATFTDSSLNPLTNYNLLIEGIDNAISSACPTPSPFRHATKNFNLPNNKPFVPAPWWDETCDQVVAERKQSTKAYRRKKSYPNYLKMKKAEANAKRSFNLARRSSFRKFCNSLNRTTPISRIW